MKNLKKVLAMVLAFACTFTMFAGAKVFEDVPAGSDYSEAITMLSDLGIIQGKDDGKYHPEDTITRAEACAMIARLMTGDPNVSQYTGAQNFADVAKGSWKDSAIGYCYINNIVVGVGNNKFEPDRAITDAEFITMVVRAMGYETPDMTQGYPFSYMSNAQAIGLLDGVNMVASTDALRGEDAQVIYNAMFTDYARGAMLVNTTHGTSVETYPTLAESVWGLDRAAVGTWTGKDDEEATLTNCKAHTWVVIGTDPAEENHILAYPIDDDTTDLYDSKESNAFKAYSFKYEGDAESVKGYQVELWGEGSHGEPTWEKGDDKFVYSEDWTIKAIKTVKGQTKFDYNPSMADSKPDNGTIVLDDETSLDLGSVAGNAKHVAVEEGGYRQLFVAKNYNGESKMDSDKKVEAALNVRDGAQYQLMDWDSDGDVDWVVVDEARYYKVESVTSKRLTVSSMKVAGTTWETSKDSVKDTWKLDDSNDAGKNFYGENIKIKYEVPDGIEEGDILEVTYTSKFDGDEVVTATVSVVDAESKSLDKVSTKDGLTLTFDDEVIAVAENVEENDVIVPANPSMYRDFNSEELGTDFDLYLNRNGFIVYSDYTTDTANYAMILDTKNGSDVLSNRGLAKVDLLTGGNEHLKGVELTSTASVDGAGYNSSKREWTETDVVGQVYKYWTNEDGQITRMRRVIDTASSSTITGENYSYDADADRLVKSDLTTGANDKYVASLEDADIIFAVKPNTESAKNNGAGITTVNAGYIQAQGIDLYVDVDDVLAVKQSDIPDIEETAGTTDDTNAAYLDNAVDADTASRVETWLGANNQDTDSTTDGTVDNWLGAFIASVDKNGAASAAVLGVENFNKFNAGSTKIGLVTDVAYHNTADGKVVELTGAFGGENKTISSVAKVDFGDIVKAYNGNSDIDIDNPSATATGTLFNSTPLDKYLENSAAYAEIATDADGNLTKVTFLNKSADNEMSGHYYTVSRNVTLGATEKNVNYLRNDGTTESELSGATYIAKQVYANSDALYSINSLPKENSKLTSDTTFYEIDGKPTLTTGYNGKQLSVVNGFDGTPDITAGGDYGVIDSSMIDQENNNKDDYGVADIVLANNGDVSAVYAFSGSLDEVAAKNVALVSTANTNIKAGDTINVQAEAISADTGEKITGLKVYDANGNDVTANAGFTVSNSTTPNKVVNETIKIAETVVAGKYTIKGVIGSTVCDAGSLTIEVASSTTSHKVQAVNFAVYNGTSYDPATTLTTAGSKYSFAVQVTGDDASTGIPNLSKENFSINAGGTALTVTGVAPQGNGYYVVTVAEDLTAETIKNAVITVSMQASTNVTVPAPVVATSQGVATSGGATSDPTQIANGVVAVNANKEELIGGAGNDQTEVYFQLTKDGEAAIASTGEVQVVNGAGLPLGGYTVAYNSKTGVGMLTKTAGGAVGTGTYDIAIDGTKVASLTIGSQAKSVGTVEAATTKSDEVEYGFGTSATYKVTGTVGYSEKELKKMALAVNSQTNFAAAWSEEAGTLTFTITPNKSGTWLGVNESGYQVDVNGTDSGAKLKVMKVTLTLADKQVTQGTSTDSKVVAKLQHNGEDINIDSLPADIATELKTNSNWSFGGTNVNSATVKNDISITGATITINADTADFNGQDVTIAYTASTSVNTISAT